MKFGAVKLPKTLGLLRKRGKHVGHDPVRVPPGPADQLFHPALIAGEETVHGQGKSLVLIFEVVIEQPHLAAHPVCDHADGGVFIAVFKKQGQRRVDQLILLAAL